MAVVITIDMNLASCGRSLWNKGVHMLMQKGAQRRSCANRIEHPVSDDLLKLQPGQKHTKENGSLSLRHALGQREQV